VILQTWAWAKTCYGDGVLACQSISATAADVQFIHLRCCALVSADQYASVVVQHQPSFTLKIQIGFSPEGAPLKPVGAALNPVGAAGAAPNPVAATAGIPGTAPGTAPATSAVTAPGATSNPVPFRSRTYNGPDNSCALYVQSGGLHHADNAGCERLCTERVTKTAKAGCA